MSNIRDVKRPAMQDPTSIKIGGKVRTIQFDLNAFGELENRFGTIQEAMKSLQGGRMQDVKMILWAGLIHEEAVLDPVTGEAVSYNMTPYEVGGWIKNPLILQEVSEKLNIAMTGDLPDAKNMVQDKNKVVDITAEVDGNAAKIATVVLTVEEQEEEAKN